MRPVHVLPDDRDLRAVLDPRVDHDRLAGVLADARAVRAQDPRLRHRRWAFADPEVEMVERCGAQTDEHLARLWLGLGRVLVAENLGAAVLVDAYRFHAGRMSHMQAARLQELAEELGLDVVGAAPASAYEETERHIRERRGGGPFSGQRVPLGPPRG